MKATSAILTQLQRQQTLFGLPPAPFFAVVLITLFAFMSFSVFVHPAAGFAGGLVVLAASWGACFRQALKDPHFERDILLAVPFFRGKRARTLIAGRRR